MAAADRSSGNNALPPDSPATCAYVPTKSDTVELTVISRGIYVGGTGDVKVVMAGDVLANAVTFVGAVAGSVLPIRAKQILSTGTTATNLLVLY